MSSLKDKDGTVYLEPFNGASVEGMFTGTITQVEDQGITVMRPTALGRWTYNFIPWIRIRYISYEGARSR